MILIFININDMENLTDKIDKYIMIQEKKEAISMSLDSKSDIKDIIDIVRKSEDKDKILSIFNEEVRKQIKKLIDGGII